MEAERLQAGANDGTRTRYLLITNQVLTLFSLALTCSNLNQEKPTEAAWDEGFFAFKTAAQIGTCVNAAAR